MKNLAIAITALFCLAGCRDQKGKTPNENYEMNRGGDMETTTATDTMPNPTQTDPAVTD